MGHLYHGNVSHNQRVLSIDWVAGSFLDMLQQLFIQSEPLKHWYDPIIRAGLPNIPLGARTVTPTITYKLICWQLSDLKTLWTGID